MIINIIFLIFSLHLALIILFLSSAALIFISINSLMTASLITQTIIAILILLSSIFLFVNSTMDLLHVILREIKKDKTQ